MAAVAAREHRRGFVAIEWVAGVRAVAAARWSCSSRRCRPGPSARNGATVAAREAARDLVDNWPNGRSAAAVARRARCRGRSRDRRRPMSTFGCRRSGEARGDEVEVDVDVYDARDRRRRDVGRVRGTTPRGRRDGSTISGAGDAVTARGRAGTITLWVLGLCISLMFLGGLSLDLWRAVADRRQLVFDGRLRRDRGAPTGSTSTRCGPGPCASIRRGRGAIALASLDEDPAQCASSTGSTSRSSATG